MNIKRIFILIPSLLSILKIGNCQVEIPSNIVFFGDVNGITSDSIGNTYFSGSFESISSLNINYLGIFDKYDNANFKTIKINGAIKSCTPDDASGWFICGEFTNINNISKNHIAHINENGTLDTGWNANVNFKPTIIKKSKDRLIIAGEGLAILSKDGSQIKYLPVTKGEIQTIDFDNSNIYAGGNFENIDHTKISKLAKLKLSGELDKKWCFNINGNINVVTLYSKHLYIGGGIKSINNLNINSLARIKKNGKIDSKWKILISGEITDLKIRYDDIYIVGSFTHADKSLQIAKLNMKGEFEDFKDLEFGGTSKIRLENDHIYVLHKLMKERVMRLNYNGEIDSTWRFIFNNNINCLEFNKNYLLIGGDFSSVSPEENGYFVKLYPNLTIDNNWKAYERIQFFDLLASGNYIYSSTPFKGLVRQFLNGQNDDSFSSLDGLGFKIINEDSFIYCELTSSLVKANLYGKKIFSIPAYSFDLNNKNIFIFYRKSMYDSTSIIKLNKNGIVDSSWKYTIKEGIGKIKILNNYIYFTKVLNECEDITKLSRISLSGKYDIDWEKSIPENILTFFTNTFIYYYSNHSLQRFDKEGKPDPDFLIKTEEALNVIYQEKNLLFVGCNLPENNTILKVFKLNK
jgi:Domain of unknown function (DUF5122) beta-propeller